MTFATDLQLANNLDDRYELAPFRDEFVIRDPNLIYLDGNSLGRLPRRIIEYMKDAIEQKWGERLIRVWNDGWINSPAVLGEKIALLTGAEIDEVLVCEATSINLFILAVAAVRARPDRSKIVSDVLNFPSDLPFLQGMIDLLGKEHRLELIPSADGISVAPGDVETAIGEDTALVCLTHVAFKSAFKYDMAYVTELAYKAGALMLWEI